MLLVPTRAGMRALEDRDLEWADVVRLVDGAEYSQPAPGSTTRRAYVAGDWLVFGEPSTYDGEECLYLIGLARRNREGQVQRRVTEQRSPKSSRRGGAGTLLPTTYREVLQRLSDAGWTWETRGKHIAVYGPEGQRGTLPISASDWRAIRNAVTHLKQVGIDVRRSA